MTKQSSNQEELRGLIIAWDRENNDPPNPTSHIDDLEQQILDLFKRMAHKTVPEKITWIDCINQTHKNIEEKFR